MPYTINNINNPPNQLPYKTTALRKNIESDSKKHREPLVQALLFTGKVIKPITKDINDIIKKPIIHAKYFAEYLIFVAFLITEKSYALSI